MPPLGRGNPRTTVPEVTLSSSRSLYLPHHRQTAAIRPDNRHNQTRIWEHKTRVDRQSAIRRKTKVKKENHQIKKLNKMTTARQTQGDTINAANVKKTSKEVLLISLTFVRKYCILKKKRQLEALLPILSAKKSQKPGHCARNKHKIPKGRRRQTISGSCELENYMLVSSLRFFFVSHIPDLETDAGNLEVPMGADQKVPQSLFPLAKAPTKGDPARQKLFAQSPL